MSTGSIKFFYPENPQGFITADESGADVFFNSFTVNEDIAKTLKAGVRVSYDLEPNSKGVLKAVNIKNIS